MGYFLFTTFPFVSFVFYNVYVSYLLERVHLNNVEYTTVFKGLENPKFLLRKEKLLKWLCKETRRNLPKGFPEHREPVRHRLGLAERGGH